VSLTADEVFVDLAGRPVLRGVSLSLEPGEVVSVVGPNGAGKSTLLRLLAGELVPRSGAARLENVPLGSLSPRELAVRRAVLAPDVEVVFEFTALELTLLGRAALESLETAAGRAAATCALEAVGLGARARDSVSRLSGGERQRVHVARVLTQLGFGDASDGGAAKLARYLLLDEPVSQQDPAHQLEVMALVRELARSGVGVLVVLHDLDLAAAFSDRMVLLEGGRVVADGPPSQVLDAELLGRVFGVEAHVDAAPWDAGSPRVSFRRRL
jgi:iron complex transport system ATP-binding protein